MARLSGLASEHHPEGPGDAPRRRRTRKAKTPSVDLTPVDLAPSSKRPASASPTDESAFSHIKRMKRVQISDTEQLAQEQEAAVSRQHSHSRRHSEPLVTIRDDEHEDDSTHSPPPATQPLPGLTPHLDRVGAPRARLANASRRPRMSMPAQLHINTVDDVDSNERQFAPLSAVLDSRVRRRLRRSHLSEEVNEFEQHKKQDSKMRKAINDLRRELRDRDKVINDLNYQLEANRLGRIDMSDDQLEELQLKLDQANKEIEELKASSLYAVSESHDNADMFDDDDDDYQMMIDPVDLNISQEQLEVEPQPNGVYAARALEMSSQVTLKSLGTMSQTTQDSLAHASQADPSSMPDKISDQAVKRYQTEFEQLTEQLANAQGALRIVAIELQNLHILAPGASTDAIIIALRHGFEHVREELEKMFPNTTAGLTNAQLLRKVVQTVKDIMEELGDKVVLINQYSKDEALLRAQVDSLIELLATADLKNKDWEQKWAKFTEEDEEKEAKIVGLEERVAALEEATNEQDVLIRERDLTVHGLNEEIENKDTSLTRLRDAIETYRTDVDELTNTVTRLEQEHAHRIEDLEQAHAADVQALEQQLDAETELRETAEGEALQKSEYIEELEARVEKLDSDIETFTTDMALLKQMLDEETALRESTEQQRDEQESISQDFGNQIETLTEQVADLEDQLADFRTNLEAERTQRIQTETSLDEANETIEQLTSQLHDAGIQANQLRSKLFETQQAKEMAIAQLTENAAAREEELETALDVEKSHRQTAEEQVDALNAECNRLQTDLTATEVALEEMTREREALQADRDDKVVQGNRTRDDLAKKLAALENTSASTITSLQANITDLSNEVAAHRATIQQLKDDAAQAKDYYNGTLADRDATIENLEADLTTARDANDKLMRENESLAKRVEDEAHELLNIMGSHAAEANNLRQAIATKDATILTLQNNATMRAAEFADELAEKVQEIEELRIMGDNRAEIIAELQGQIEQLKERFRAAEADTRATMDTLTESRRKLLEENEQLSAALLRRNADALQAIQEMKIRGLEVKTVGAGDLRKVAHGKVTKVTEKVKVGKKKSGGVRKSRRQWDSGFGVDENVENEEDVDEGLLLEA